MKQKIQNYREMTETNSNSNYNYIVPDLEEGKIIKETHDKDVAEVKSILKNTEKKRNDNTAENILKLLIAILTVLLCSPIIICDLYFGLNDSSCVEESPPSLSISLQTYMLTSAFVGLSALTIIIISTCIISSNNSNTKNNCIVTISEIISTLFSVFHLIWNILGAIVFWGFAYKNNLCDKNVSTYLFITLIIKLIANYFGIMNAFKKEKSNQTYSF
jgi:hypothetical protein